MAHKEPTAETARNFRKIDKYGSLVIVQKKRNNDANSRANHYCEPEQQPPLCVTVV